MRRRACLSRTFPFCPLDPSEPLATCREEAAPAPRDSCEPSPAAAAPVVAAVASSPALISLWVAATCDSRSRTSSPLASMFVYAARSCQCTGPTAGGDWPATRCATEGMSLALGYMIRPLSSTIAAWCHGIRPVRSSASRRPWASKLGRRAAPAASMATREIDTACKYQPMYARAMALPACTR